MEVVGMGRPDVRDVLAGLGPGGRVGGVGMDDASDLPEGLVEHKVGRGVG